MKKNLLMSLLCLPLLFSCNKTKEPNYEWIDISTNSTFIYTTKNAIVFPFNTTMSLRYFKNYDLNTYDENFNKELSSLFLDNVVSLHKKLDRHNYYYVDDNVDDSLKEIETNVKTINDSYGSGEEIVCSDELYSLLKLGYEMTLLTEGSFNFFMGKLTSMWDYILENVSEDYSLLDLLDPYKNPSQANDIKNHIKALPTIKEIENILTFNDENQSVIFNALEDKDGLSRSLNDSKYRPEITSGGIAKGFATDLLKEILLSNGYNQGFLNSGASSITSLSDMDFTEKKYQNISIIDPRTGNSLIKDIALTFKLVKDYSLSTSGNYTYGKSYSFKDNEGNNIYRHHIIDPKTGEPSSNHASVTLVSNSFSNGQLDALSTAFVNTTTSEGLKLREKLLEEFVGYDLSIVFIDITQESKLDVTIVGDIKDSVTINVKDAIVHYE